ncbi:hypothetical protein THAOC_22873, partial [Thalassiosira oceanica]
TNKKRTRTTTYIKAPRKSSGSEDRLRSPQKKKNRPGEQTQAQSDHATAKEGAAKEADQVLFGLKEAAAQAGLDVSAEVVVEEIPLENIDESADESADGSGVKELSRLKGVIYRRTKALAKLGEIEQSSRRGASSKDDTDVLLDEIDDYVENDDVVVDDEDDEDQAQPP